MVSLSYCIVLLFLIGDIPLSNCFQSRIVNRHLTKSLNLLNQDGIPQSVNFIIKNKIMSILKVISLSTIISSMNVDTSFAKVYFDTDVYGDKELKIATVNKIKQKLRNAILQDITIAPDLLKLAITDALGYEITSQDGGLDGSIVFELDKDENKALKKAVDVILSIKKDLQRTNTV